ncbi:Hsp70 family protein [Cupriavidus taiwanensis]|uniref:Putative heat-shock chaperone Hsp70/DnaK n=1 Tax=Cupriavidus taiwanensis TaxID=164546 RepID=A0A7Z7J7M3_9BURK|nr:Hsp70 family protein [Cupriavidus taiwanensis]SOY85384.1 putative heat-shock chaperone Hsp70/DnaK [Cupriavidus taiwanensis]SOZ03835.1 putative heat-shock chaperone Hsp70/DnaK [Cupriavidus taiwanensis]SOZ04626.1 putative heat-shock chaperone Hsp70/DnaK [Cupriavidus taiwanensis]SPC09971.1 putative heat-shock chaperone Hsp70/DnaK [Cupriavidus taiwanensis]SPD39720.1 putative heat-shock chaperone Hsp70/DnaK [Cupriavidus taiwanensis]
MSEARYAIGIDLGTTHSAVSYVDLAASDGEKTSQRVLPITQLTAPGAVEDLELLPSFLYLPHESELAPGDLNLPWSAARDFAVGEMARSRGAGTPIRLVSSAKSWLCHPGVDRRAAILPADAPPEVPRVSPLEASVRYLTHLREAWDQAHPDAPFGEQDVTVTIPASFDPAARELTAEAAAAAGYARMTLLEEPQAALYSWIQKSAGQWRKQVKVGDIILVVDVGGGTTDLSLIAVIEREGNLELHRIAVGDHILLGGDNMDLALAHVVARKLAAQGTQADPWQLRALTYACRAAKETLLTDPATDAVPLVVPSRGSKLIGGSIRTELTRAELTQTILEGFFPQVDASARPVSRARAGLTQLGLPYAQDAAITRHLAAFLGRQAGALAEIESLRAAQPEGAAFLRPTAVLFNGGVFKSGLLVERILQTLNGWLAAEGAAPARLLDGAELDLAVARGAAYYGYVRRGKGVRIRGGTARAYYVAVESSMPAVPGFEPPIQALCVAPFGMEEGTEAELPPQEFGLVVGEPVHFRFFGSSVRRQDQVGTLLDYWGPEELQELEEIQATLPAEGRTAGEVVPVRLHARVTEAGTLELEAVPRGSGERWKVQFDVRGNADA